MILCRRRIVILAVIAVLGTAAAIAPKGTASSSSTLALSPKVLFEATRRLRDSSIRHSATKQSSEPQTSDAVLAKPSRREFTVYRNEVGEIVCREATAEEIKARASIDPESSGLRQINHLTTGKDRSGQSPGSNNLVIVLRATQQLQQNAAATAAFNRAAQNWEDVIKSPITIYLDVDFGATNFGQTWPAGVLGATRSLSSSYLYQSVRGNLIAEANGEGNATKQGIFNGLPSTTVPSDLGDATAVDVSNSVARAIGLLPSTAQPTAAAARIAFNGGFTFDFDPTDGITSNAIDFDAVATHEIGHALGFSSDAGLNIPKPTVWDLYRFRTGVTTSTFPTATRVFTIGGSPDTLQFYFVPGNSELGLSNGGPFGSPGNSDGWQSSHWKHVATCGGYIGIMDPAIGNGCRRTITSNDMLALGSFGYNLTNNNAPPSAPPASAPPANDNFANAQTIGGCAGIVTGSTFGSTSEAGEPSHDPSDSSSLSPGHTAWYQLQAPASATVAFTTAGSDFDTVLAVYTGSDLNSLNRIVFNDDEQLGVVTSRVTLNVTVGTTYWIAVDGWGGDTGAVALSWNGCGLPAATPIPTTTPSPAPGGVRKISFSANSIVYDPVSQRIFASVTANAANFANSITEINPYTGTVGGSVFVGANPGKLALDNTFHYIYASLTAIPAVRRFDLTSRKADLQFYLGFDPSLGPRYVGDLEALPFTPGSVAVSRRFFGTSPEHAGVAVYDNGISRPVATAAGYGSNIIEFGASSSALYGVNAESTEFGFRKMSIDNSGVSINSVNTNLINGFGEDIRFDNGLLYTSNGRIIDPQQGTGAQVGSFGSIGFNWTVLPDPISNRVYFLSTFSSPVVLNAFDKTTHAQLGSLSIPGVSGDSRNLIKWGADGLAFTTTGNQLFLLSTNDVVPSASPTPTLTPTPTPGPCPTVLIVNNAGDSSDILPGDGVCNASGGGCTLRAAIQEANAQPACGSVTINFSGVTSPIGLGTALPNISHNINLSGPGPDQLTITRSGADDFRIFTVDSEVTASMSGLTISNGRLNDDGGGILNNGTLTVVNGVVKDNNISNPNYNGGGICNRGTLNVVNTTIRGNVANNGGGITNFGTLTVVNSSINSNTAGGVAGPGGGINNIGVATIINSTISGNTCNIAAGGIFNQSGNLTLTNSTVSLNTAKNGTAGGVAVGAGTVTLRNTIIANNSNTDVSGNFTSQDYNLIGNTAGANFTGPTAHHIVNVNALLGPLANNGGPTMTHALLAGSPAIDTGSNVLAVDQNGNPLTTDQRDAGFTRIVNGTVDIGAFEAQSGTPTPTPTPIPTPGALQLVMDESGPALNQVAALDSVLLTRDPFPVVNAADLLNLGVDRNTRVIVFAMNLQLLQGETSSAVTVSLVDSNNRSYDIAAEDVRPVPNFPFTQVVFRLPNNTSIGTCIITLKVHGQTSNSGSIRIRI